MATLINPYENFAILDTLLSQGDIVFSKTPNHDLHQHIDYPDDLLRVIYAHFEDNKLIGLCVFAKGDNLHDLPCFDIGYAIRKGHQQQGIGSRIVTEALDAFKQFLGKHELYEFAIEAVVGRDNDASNALAKNVLGVTPVKTTDVFTGTPVFAYQKTF